MNFLESLSVALSSLWGNKMRSFLTMLGIIIGISSVITIVSLGQGSQAVIGSEYEKIGVNRVIIMMNYEGDYNYEDYFDEEDIETVNRVFADQLTGVSASISLSGNAVKGRENAPLRIYGSHEDYGTLLNLDIVKGRYLIEADVKGARKVCVIDKKLAEELYGTTDVLGEKLSIDTNYSKLILTIVGVYQTPEGTLSQLTAQMMGETTTIYMPISIAKSMGYGDRYYSFEVGMADMDKIDEVSKEIVKVLERSNRTVGKDYYTYYTAQQEMDMMNQVLGVLASVISAIAAISLLVGGIGVMNIMLVSVTERTREIGIRKAIGASRKDILIQFLVEAMIISGTGGIIGTILGLIFQSIIAMSLDIPPSASLSTILIAVAFSAAVGIFFGMYPANKAAKLDPIDALRYE